MKLMQLLWHTIERRKCTSLNKLFSTFYTQAYLSCTWCTHIANGGCPLNKSKWPQLPRSNEEERLRGPQWLAVREVWQEIIIITKHGIN